MEPIGTITQYFPFIDEETKNVLEYVMAHASDYYDFVQKLGEMVLNTDSRVMTVYFAIHHAILAYEYKLIDKIREKYGEHQILEPNLFFASSYQGTYEDVEKVHEMANAILATQPDDWIALEMYFMKFEVDMRNYPKTMYETETMNKIKELMDSESNFGFYEATLYDYLSEKALSDGDADGRLRCINRALRAAKKFNDRVRVAHLLTKKANIIMDQDRAECKELLQQAYAIVESSLGIPTNYANILDKLGLVDATRGKFDSAIKGLLDVITLRERAGLSTANASYFLSTLYNLIGEPESGLEWGLMTEDQVRNRPILANRAKLNQIWSLILLNRLTEAQILLDTYQEPILKSGDESQLAWLYFDTGVLEMARGDFASALSSVEQGLEIYEQSRGAFIFELIFLYQLAKIEVYSCTSGETVSPSLAILEDKALSEDLPGILGLVLLLKADAAIMNNDPSLLREIISQLESLSEEEDLKFLKPHFDSLVGKL
jgi:tetratricopeptide (TPR) repeat protein